MRQHARVLPLLLAAAAFSAQGAQAQSSKPWLGVVVEGTSGGPAKIVEIDRGSPAARAGLKVGDVVLRFDGKPAGDVDGFIRRIQSAKVGRQISLTVRRGNASRRIAVSLGRKGGTSASAKPAAKTAPKKPKSAPKSTSAKASAPRRAARNTGQPARAMQGGRAFLGITLDLGRSGARIGQITARSAAQRNDLRAGDVIVSVAGKRVATRDDVVRAIRARKPGDVLPLEIMRSGRRIKKSVRLGRGGGTLAAATPRAAQQATDDARAQLKRARAALDRARNASSKAKGSVAKGSKPATKGMNVASKKPSSSKAMSSKGMEWSSDMAAAMRSAKRSGKPVLVDFTAKWSAPCRMLTKNFTKNARAMTGMIPVRIDVDRQERVADKYGINSIPHVILFSPTGKRLREFTGYLDASDLGKRLSAWKSKSKGIAKAKPKARTSVRAAAAPRSKSKGTRRATKPSSRSAVTGKYRAAEAPKASKKHAHASELAELRGQIRSLVEAQNRMRRQLDRLIELIGRQQGKTKKD